MLKTFIGYMGLLLKNQKFNSVELKKRIDKYMIGTRPFFYPLHKQPILNKYFKRNEINRSLPNSENIWLKGLYLPSGIGIKNEEIKYVAEKLNFIFSDLNQNQ